MARIYLEFEKAIGELEEKIEALRYSEEESTIDLSNEIERLSIRSEQLTKALYERLTPWQIVQVSRHPARPYTLDYVQAMFTDFHELHGDRCYGDDQSIVGGLARFDDRPCVVVGHQKGRSTKERTLRNFGYPRPEGYRKALRLFRLAEKFRLPVFTFIDTPGAWPGIEAEEHNQSEAIGRNLMEMAGLQTPIITTVIGEGGSGGALAIGVCDVAVMLQFATYSVISPESCSSILWKSAGHGELAANALGLTAHRLKALGLIDKIANEPVGGAHRDPVQMASALKRILRESLRAIDVYGPTELLARRHERLMRYGAFRDTSGTAPV